MEGSTNYCFFIIYYLEDYSPRLGLENEIWFKKYFEMGWVKFCER